MSKFEMLHEIMRYITINWSECRDPLTPTWLYTLMEIAEEAYLAQWDYEKIGKVLEAKQ